MSVTIFGDFKNPKYSNISARFWFFCSFRHTKHKQISLTFVMCTILFDALHSAGCCVYVWGCKRMFS